MVLQVTTHTMLVMQINSLPLKMLEQQQQQQRLWGWIWMMIMWMGLVMLEHMSRTWAIVTVAAVATGIRFLYALRASCI